MGDSNVQRRILKTTPPTAAGYSAQDEGGDRPKGLCHVTFSKSTVPSLVLSCEKQKRLPALFLMIFVSRGYP